MKRILWISILVLVCAGCRKSPPLLWKFQTGAPIYSSPDVAGSNLIIAGTDGFVYALDLKTGKLSWKQHIGALAIGTPLVKDNLIYIGGGKGDLFCFDFSGNMKWKFHTGNSIRYKPCADSSGIYFGSRDYNFYKIDYNGNQLWSYKTKYYIWGTCSFYKDLVFTSAWDFNLYALDRTTGSVKWKNSAGVQIYGSPAVLNDTVYYATHSKIRRFDAATGKMLNQAQTTYLDEVFPWNGYLWTNESGLHKRKLDGTEIGSLTFSAYSGFKPTTNGKYLILGGSDSIYGVTPDLKILWRFKTDDDFWTSGVSAGGVYYVGSRGGIVYALQIP